MGTEPSRRPFRPSLRTLSLASVTLVGALVLTVLVGFLASSTQLTQSIEDVERDTRAVAIATEIERSIRDYNRLANLLSADRDPQVEEARAAAEASMRDMIAERATEAESVTEVQLLAEISQNLDVYVARRAELESRGVPLDRLLQETRPVLEATLASADNLGRYHAERLRIDHAAVDRMNRATLVVSTLAGALLLGGVIIVIVGVRALILRPLSEIRRAMERFERGDTEAHAPERGSREISEIAETFNDMAETIRRRRRDTLDFLAGIAHDLRNPLSALKLSWQSLIHDPAPLEPVRLEQLDRQLDRLSRMVGDLLDAVRIEAGHLELETEDMDMRNAAREVVALYGPTSPAHEVTLQAPAQPVEIRADPLRIEQVISNLVSNALKYSPDGGPIEVRVGVVDDEAELSVSDRGVGIASDELPHLFTPFRRGVQTKQVSRGAGLGLSVVHRIVAAHGGRIDVDSAPGEGSTFRVRFPLAPRTGADATDPRQDEPAGDDPSSRHPE